MKDMKDIFKQISQVQEQMHDMQSKLAAMSVEGESGGGLVKVGMTGQRSVYEVSIDESVLDDREMLEDLIAGAFNDALRKTEKLHQDKFSDMAGNFNLPSIPPNWLG